jgi:hypothetical protein
MPENLKITLQSLLVVLVLMLGVIGYQKYQESKPLTVPEKYRGVSHINSKVYYPGDTYFKSDSVSLWPIYVHINIKSTAHLKDATTVTGHITYNIIISDSFFNNNLIYKYRQPDYFLKQITDSIRFNFIQTCNNIENYDTILINKKKFDNNIKYTQKNTLNTMILNQLIFNDYAYYKNKNEFMNHKLK